MASCKGSCTAQANFNCDISCSEKGYAMCEAKYSGGCNVMCSQPMGSLNCGGQWVNTQDLQTCIDSLKSMFNIEVSGSASGNCSGDTCSGQAQGSIKCDVGAPGEPALPGGLVAGGLGFAAIALARRAKRAR
jgi:hypothetical protein